MNGKNKTTIEKKKHILHTHTQTHKHTYTHRKQKWTWKPAFCSCLKPAFHHWFPQKGAWTALKPPPSKKKTKKIKRNNSAPFMKTIRVTSQKDQRVEFGDLGGFTNGVFWIQLYNSNLGAVLQLYHFRYKLTRPHGDHLLPGCFFYWNIVTLNLTRCTRMLMPGIIT